MYKHKQVSGGVLVMLLMIGMAVILVGHLGYRQYQRMNLSYAWVASALLNAGKLITNSDLTRISIAVSDKPAGTIDKANYIVGKRLKIDKQPGETFRTDDLDRPAAKERTWLTDGVPEGRILFPFTPPPALEPFSSQLHKGDRFDIIITSGNGQVRPIAFNVILLGTMKPPKAKKAAGSDGDLDVSEQLMKSLIAGDKKSAGPGTLMMLALRPKDVYPMASAKGAGGVISFIIHGQKELASGARLNFVPPNQKPRTRHVEMYEGLKKSSVKVSL
jgi:hypothetical protein